MAIILNVERANTALKARNFRSWGEFSRELGIHRNTLQKYLSGTPALPRALEQIIAALELDPGEALKDSIPRRCVKTAAIVPLLADLNHAAPDCAFVLFGSRARSTAKPFSDYDIGVFRKEKLGLDEFSRLLDFVAQWNDSNMTTVQLTNLSIADDAFLASISEHMEFVTGSLSEWLNILSLAKVRVYG